MQVLEVAGGLINLQEKCTSTTGFLGRRLPALQWSLSCMVEVQFPVQRKEDKQTPGRGPAQPASQLKPIKIAVSFLFLSAPNDVIILSFIAG